MPKDVREKPKIRPGQKVEAFAIGSSIQLVPIEPINSLQGASKGLTPFEREPDRGL
jgi:bifunctional DNA-binding transcriptional regulator/antitoxin component of YhaV-PrlF toxin-antitoxin module